MGLYVYLGDGICQTVCFSFIYNCQLVSPIFLIIFLFLVVFHSFLPIFSFTSLCSFSVFHSSDLALYRLLFYFFHWLHFTKQTVIERKKLHHDSLMQSCQHRHRRTTITIIEKSKFFFSNTISIFTVVWFWTLTICATEHILILSKQYWFLGWYRMFVLIFQWFDERTFSNYHRKWSLESKNWFSVKFSVIIMYK